MSWHHIPKDDAWKQAHLAMLAKLGKRAWLHCDSCRHSIMIEPDDAEGMLLAGAAQYAGWGLKRKRPVTATVSPLGL